jgi:hypothetical protein
LADFFHQQEQEEESRHFQVRVGEGSAVPCVGFSHLMLDVGWPGEAEDGGHAGSAVTNDDSADPIDGCVFHSHEIAVPNY